MAKKISHLGKKEHHKAKKAKHEKKHEGKKHTMVKA